MPGDLNGARHLRVGYGSRICTLTIDRPGDGNRWDAQTALELRALVDALMHDNQTSPGGRSFCRFGQLQARA